MGEGAASNALNGPDVDVSRACLSCARACALPAWLPAFQDVTWPTVVVPLHGTDGAAFSKCLDAARGVRLPAPPPGRAISTADPRWSLTRNTDFSEVVSVTTTSDVVDVQQQQGPATNSGRSASQSLCSGLNGNVDGNSSDDGSDDDGSVSTFAEAVPELEADILAAIAHVGGTAFIKLNWTAPADAVWASDANDLQCMTPGHVYTLLAASDLVRYDVALLAALRDGGGHDRSPSVLALQIVLRRWYPLQRSGEFRCFVRCGTLVGISQRHVAECFSHLVNDTTSVRDAITSFFCDEFAILTRSAPVSLYSTICRLKVRFNIVSPLRHRR